MKNKKIIKLIIFFIIVALLSSCGYFFICSIESKIPDNKLEDIQIETKKVMERQVFTIYPQNEKSEKTILYFHGGAYVAEMTNKHWDFLQKLSKETKSTIIVPDYPLAPKYSYSEVLEFSKLFYDNLIEKQDGNNLILMGDSAGGGLALGLAEHASINNKKLPSKTILISPWIDVTMSNPRISEIQPKDKDLKKINLYIAGILYSRGIDKKDNYFANPLYGNIAKLKDVTIYTGTYDILNPDCHLLQEKGKENGADIHIKEYETASHVWIIKDENELSQKAYSELLKDIGE